MMSIHTGRFLKRTKATDLSEEELLILDVLFEARDTFESLTRDNYASWHNLPYSHHLETDLLKDLVDGLVDRGILSPHPLENRMVYGLTEAGGKLWEIERAPNWERYCTDTSTEEGGGHWMVSVESPSIVTAQAFMDCANQCRLYRFKQEDIRITTSMEETPSTVYWKAFSTICSISVPTDLWPDTNQVDWPEYERRRVWWRSLTELATFQEL